MTDLMINQLNMSVSWLRDFNDEGLHFILMFLALIYILISKKEKYHRRLFIGYSLIFTLVYFCPVTSWVDYKSSGRAGLLENALDDATADYHCLCCG